LAGLVVLALRDRARTIAVSKVIVRMESVFATHISPATIVPLASAPMRALERELVRISLVFVMLAGLEKIVPGEVVPTTVHIWGVATIHHAIVNLGSLELIVQPAFALMLVLGMENVLTGAANVKRVSWALIVLLWLASLAALAISIASMDLVHATLASPVTTARWGCVPTNVLVTGTVLKGSAIVSLVGLEMIAQRRSALVIALAMENASTPLAFVKEVTLDSIVRC
jgi:hypothetical protein